MRWRGGREWGSETKENSPQNIREDRRRGKKKKKMKRKGEKNKRKKPAGTKKR